MQGTSTASAVTSHHRWGSGGVRLARGGETSSFHAALTVLAVILSAVLLALLGGSGPARAGAGVVAAGVSPELAALAQSDPAERVEVIAQVQPRVALADAAARVRALGGSDLQEVRLIHAVATTLPAVEAARLGTDPSFRAVSINSPVEPRAKAFSARRVDTSFLHSVDAVKAWRSKSRIDGSGVGVAVVDSGVDGHLDDFRVSRRNGLSRVRVAAAVHPDASDPSDHFGHGTHVAGLIAGNSDARESGDPLRGRYMGVAPAARIISIKASDDAGRSSVLDVIHGIQFAVDHRERYGIRVLNLSLSSAEQSSYRDDPLAAAVEAAWLQGIFVVAAAGNEGNAPGATSYAPGNDPFVLTVGAVDDQGTRDIADDVLADWSSRGATLDGIAKPEVLAPGAHIVSVLADDSHFARTCPDCVVDDEYFRVGGTSMAAAVASGAAALILDAHPDWTPDMVKAALVSTARDVPGAGREVSVWDAIAASPDREDSTQTWETNVVVDSSSGEIDHEAAKWRAAKWRLLERMDPAAAKWNSFSWVCDCGGDRSADDDEVEPGAAKWGAAKWGAAKWNASFAR